jgi:hypothetical protein
MLVSIIIDAMTRADRHPSGCDALVELTARPHKLRVELCEWTGKAAISFQWALADGPLTQVVPAEALFVSESAARRARVPPLSSQPGFPAHHKGEVWCAAFAPDGRRAVSGGQDGTMRLWDVETCRELQKLDGHKGGVISATFSADGSRILSAGADATICLWDVTTGREIRRFRGHTMSARRALFLPGEQRILSAGDWTMRLWDVATGRELHRFLGHSRGIWGLELSPDGRSVVSGSLDHTVRRWQIPR